MTMLQNKGLSLLAWVQGIYFFITGIWPLVHMPSFLFVTGPKTDLWLVETVGILITSISIGILLSAYTKDIGKPIILIAISSAGGMATVDITYVIKRIISPVYLLDAIPEVLFILCWFFILLKGKENNHGKN